MGTLCKDCIFYSRMEHLSNETQDETGICQRYPPTIQINEKIPIFPIVYAEAWCGEFKEVI